MKFPRRGTYRGRLAFDPETGFHIDPEGRRVVTVDGGKSWRYARRGDASHNFRFQERTVVVDSTANAESAEPHHWNVHPDDPHSKGLVSHPDAVSATVTSHTEAWQ